MISFLNDPHQMYSAALKRLKCILKAMLVLLVLTLAVVYICHFLFINRKYFRLASPGLCLPFIGHAYKLLSGDGRNDPVNVQWDMYKKNNSRGLMWMRVFNTNILYVGDFETLKYIFNHPDVQARTLENLKKHYHFKIIFWFCSNYDCLRSWPISLFPIVKSGVSLLWSPVPIIK